VSNNNGYEAELIAPNVTRNERESGKSTAGKGFRADFDFRNNRNCAPTRFFKSTSGTNQNPECSPLNRK